MLLGTVVRSQPIGMHFSLVTRRKRSGCPFGCLPLKASDLRRKDRQMKVALLYPEVYDMARFKEGRKEFPPFGVLYLAAAIRDADHDVQIYKITKSNAALDLSIYDAIGFSLASSATYGIMLAAR